MGIRARLKSQLTNLAGSVSSVLVTESAMALLSKVAERLPTDTEPHRLENAQEQDNTTRIEANLQIVFVQYDREKYRGALEGLLARLEAIGGLDYSVVVVDNKRPGFWTHRVSSRVVHIGGDNAHWEFSAFDRALEYLDAHGSAKVYAFVTDALAAYGAEFLTLIEAATFERAEQQQACVGWVDAWPAPVTALGETYQEWLRTSFLVVPSSVLSKIRPLTTPLDRTGIFGIEPTAPFADDAPVGESLQKYLVDWLVVGHEDSALPEAWHSRFVLSSETTALFQDKVSAILREQLLSARLRAAKTPCYDFRLSNRVREAGVLWDEITPEELEAFQWGGWRTALVGREQPTRHHVDVCDVPDAIEHGADADFVIEGWVLAPTQPDLIRVSTSSNDVYYSPCNMIREDVVGAYPGYAADPNCGFHIEGSFRGLRPGSHEIKLDFDDGLDATVVKTVRVVPKVVFEVQRLFVPDSWPAEGPLPVSLEGTLRGTFLATSVEVALDDHEVDIAVPLGPSTVDSSGVQSQPVLLNGRLAGKKTGGQHLLELRFALSNGKTYTWKKHLAVGAHSQVPHTMNELELGPFDPDTGLAYVLIGIDLYGVAAGDRLLLSRNGTDVLDRPVYFSPDLGGSGVNRARVAIEQSIDGIAPGIALFELSVKRGSERIVLWKSELCIALRRPELTLDSLDVAFTSVAGRSIHRIHAIGWVRNHFLVDCLAIEVDGSRLGVIGLSELRPDVAEALQQPIVAKQGFNATFDAEVAPGEHVVHVIAYQKSGEAARISRRLRFEKPPAQRFSLTSHDLEQLRRGTTARYYGAISLRLAIRTEEDDLAISLLVDDRVVDERILTEAGSHEVEMRCVPASPGEYEVRVMVSSQGKRILITDPALARFEPTTVPADTRRALDLFVDRFDIRQKISGYDDGDLATRLIERQAERIPDYLAMIETVGRRLSADEQPCVAAPDTADGRETRPLKVLFVTWEVPSPYHGGGVYLTNILKRLGTRHEITLVHTQGVNEVGHVDAVRPYVRKVISVARTHLPAHFRANAHHPHLLYDLYIPELRRLIELEVATGDYDLVDYEYWTVGPYIVPGIPSVLGVIELGYTALLNTNFTAARSLESAVPELDRLLRSFHYDTVELPALCRNLVTLTEEDAYALKKYCPDAKVYVNQSGVDVESFATVEDEEPTAGPPTFVYVGNFQHPPNVRAVRFFAEKVMPRLLQRHPTAQFHVVGSQVPAELRELEATGNVTVDGFVPDLRPILANATAFVAPIFTGTGMRIKTLEAFASGTLLIGSGLSVRGTGAIDGEHFILAETAADFADAAARAISDAAGTKAIADAGQRLAAGYDWSKVADRQEAIWHQVVKDASEETGSREAHPRLHQQPS